MDTSSLEIESIEAQLKEFEAAERARLGLDASVTHWTDAMIDPIFTARERPHITVLTGGLTIAHDYLIAGSLRGLGYNCKPLDCPDNESLRYGKEFGNVSQCNPTYFTVGNLVKELCRLRDEEGLTSEQVIRNYIFMTAGACGPCRFGMYVTEYRKALRDAGFDGFRVLLFQQTGGVKQACGDDVGLRLDPPFFFGIARALFAGDVINAVGYRIRPYELEPGATDRALEAIKRDVYDALVQHKSVVLALRRGRKLLASIKVDRTQPKAKVSILGEFWAMTTEGDGNYHLQRFIEQEGGENEIQLLAFLLLYNIWEFRHDTEQRVALKDEDSGQFGLQNVDVGLRLAGLWVGELALRTIFQTFARAIGLNRFQLPNMDEIAKVAHGHYNQELRGGEGHMEVAKLILNVIKNKSHMTLSVKPFGCMPSSGVSDGVQSAITELHPTAIYCAVETSGDAAVNFYSRVQLFLFKAKQRAQSEYAAALEQYGVTAEQVRDYVSRSSQGGALHRSPHRACGTAADLVHEVGPLIGRSRSQRALLRAQRAVAGVRDFLAHDGRSLLHTTARVVPYLPAVGRWAVREGLGMTPALTQNIRTHVEKWVRLDARQEVAVAAASTARDRVPDQGKVRLRVKTRDLRVDALSA
jgi:predicted nucleotide-binding protein (sugar kinase/HSP70/actin superfamily)